MTSQTPNIRRWRAFSLLAAAAFMTVTDLTIVNTALPTIARKVAGTPPATIVNGSQRDDGSRYAAMLPDAGVEVRALLSDALRSLPLGELVRGVQ